MFTNNTTTTGNDMGMNVFMESKQATFLVVFNSLQIIFGTAANMFEMLFFLKNQHLCKSISDKLTLNLAIADFVALTTYLPWRTYLLHIQGKTNHYEYYTSLFVFCIFNTGNAIVLIGIDRFIAITRPYRYRVLVAGKVFWLGVTLAWGTALALGIGHYLSYKYMLDIHNDYEFFLSCLSIFQMLLMSVIYTVILKIARGHVKSISQQTLHQNGGESTESIKVCHVYCECFVFLEKCMHHVFYCMPFLCDLLTVFCVQNHNTF